MYVVAFSLLLLLLPLSFFPFVFFSRPNAWILEQYLWNNDGIFGCVLCRFHALLSRRHTQELSPLWLPCGQLRGPGCSGIPVLAISSVRVELVISCLSIALLWPFRQMLTACPSA